MVKNVKEEWIDSYTDGVEMRCIQRINYTQSQWESSAIDDIRIFIEVHLLPGKLLLVVAMHPLDGSRANQLSRVEPSAGAAHPLTRWGSSKPWALLEYPIRKLPRGRIKNPSQSLSEGSNKSPIMSSITTAAPSHLGCRETPKSNKQSAANSKIKCH
jgi:hypothetical protein